METWQKTHALELSSLRQQLLDIETQSDERTAIGKLHRQIIALQVSEATTAKRLEESQGKVWPVATCVYFLKLVLEAAVEAILIPTYSTMALCDPQLLAATNVPVCNKRPWVIIREVIDQQYTSVALIIQIDDLQVQPQN